MASFFRWRRLMQIKINGQIKTLAESISLDALLEIQSLKIENCVVLRNGEVVEKKDFSTTFLFDEDNLTLLSFVGGG